MHAHHKIMPEGGGDPKILKREGLDISFLKGEGGGGRVCSKGLFFQCFHMHTVLP